jgi:hypothetical protein
VSSSPSEVKGTGTEVSTTPGMKVSYTTGLK